MVSASARLVRVSLTEILGAILRCIVDHRDISSLLVKIANASLALGMVLVLRRLTSMGIAIAPKG